MGAQRFRKPYQRGADSSDSDDNEKKRVVKSAKDRRFEAMANTINNVKKSYEN